MEIIAVFNFPSWLKKHLKTFQFLCWLFTVEMKEMHFIVTNNLEKHKWSYFAIHSYFMHAFEEKNHL